MAKKGRPKGPTLIQRSRRKSPAEKAIYHDQAGAGRSRVKRRFFELTERDQQLIGQTLERHITWAISGFDS